VSSFDVRVFAIRRRPGRRVFEVRWRVAGGDKSRSFITRALADSYRAELIRAARRGLEFDPATGEPQAWAAPAPATVTGTVALCHSWTASENDPRALLSDCGCEAVKGDTEPLAAGGIGRDLVVPPPPRPAR